jgi:hypothetical protein
LTALGLSELQTFYFLEFVGEGSLGFIEAAKKKRRRGRQTFLAAVSWQR